MQIYPVKTYYQRQNCMANDLVWVKNIPFVLMNRSGHTYATLVYTTKLNINV